MKIIINRLILISINTNNYLVITKNTIELLLILLNYFCLSNK